jgi:hypothetical protein
VGSGARHIRTRPKVGRIEATPIAPAMVSVNGLPQPGGPLEQFPMRWNRSESSWSSFIRMMIALGDLA